MSDYAWVSGNVGLFDFTPASKTCLYQACHALLSGDRSSYDQAFEALACPVYDSLDQLRLEEYVLNGWHLAAAASTLLEEYYAPVWRTAGAPSQLADEIVKLLPSWSAQARDIEQAVHTMTGQADTVTSPGQLVHACLAVIAWVCHSNGVSVEDVAY